MEGQILSKLFDMGVLNSQAKLSDVDNKLTVAAFCRRRLAVIMVMAKMAETVSAVRDHLRFSFPVLLAHALSLIFAVLLFFLSRLLFFFLFFLAHLRRPSSLSSKVTSASGQTRSLTLLISSPGTSTSDRVSFFAY